MSKEKKNLYEGMYVISAKLSDEVRKKAYQKLVDEIESRGGKIVKVHERGRQRLAYEIDGHKEGFYYLFYFEIQPGAIEELWKEYKLMQELIRFITLRTDKVLEKLEFKQLSEV